MAVTSVSKIELAIGTTNYRTSTENWVTRAHGLTWMTMMSDLREYVNSQGYSSKVRMYGASDIELQWNTPEAPRNWVDGYSSGPVNIFLLNYGNCNSCPRTDCPGCIPGGEGYIWNQEQVWYVSWGNFLSYPFPEIYRQDGQNANEWFTMSVYALTNHGSAMAFYGALTQWQACQGESQSAIKCRQDRLDNKPGKGWGQLLHYINIDPSTREDVNRSSDIR
jgi:hypothetical protein